MENKSKWGRGRERISAMACDGSGTPKCDGFLYLLDWFLRRPYTQQLHDTHIKQSHNCRKKKVFVQQFPSAPKGHFLYLLSRTPKTEVLKWQQEISG